MEKAWKNRPKDYVVQSFCSMYIFTVFILFLWSKFAGVDLISLVKTSSLLFLGLILFYFHYCMEFGNKRKGAKEILLLMGGYLFSFLTMIVSHSYNTYVLWMFGVVTIGVVLRPYFGIGILILLTVMDYTMVPERIEDSMYTLVMGTLLCIVGTYMISRKSFFWGMWLILFMEISIYLIRYDFILDNISLREMLLYWGSSILVIWVSGRIDRLWKKKKIINIKELSTKNPLQERMKAFSLVLYEHSSHVAFLSFFGAQEIGCDYEIAWEAGFYHEIGRIQPDSNYIEAGIQLGEENHLCQQVISIIPQCNGKFEKPKSKEAVVVMFSDSILSSLDYLRKKDEVSAYDELVEQIFRVRFSQGMLEQSELTFTEYKKLKDFYKEFGYDNSFGL